MPKYVLKPIVVEARQLTVNNLTEMAAWCNGCVRGVKLPEKDRCIDFWSNDHERRAEIGDYITKREDGGMFDMCLPSTLEDLFEEVP